MTNQEQSACVWPNGEIPDGAYHLPPTWVRTNNRAEYYAAIKAMELMNEYDPEKTKHSWYKKGWKKSGGAIKNLDLVKVLHEHCRTRTIKWTHVPSHTGGTDYNSVWNDKVDKLAYSAVHDDDNSMVVHESPIKTPRIDTFFNVTL